MLDQLTTQLAASRSLDAEQVREAVAQLVDERISAEIKAGFLTALARKGETPAEIAEFARALRDLLDPGVSTVYVLGIVDIYKLWQLGDQLSSLGIIDCRVIWATTLFGWFPCGTMLNPLNSEATASTHAAATSRSTRSSRTWWRSTTRAIPTTTGSGAT